ncbi:hypothetical protein GGF46_005279 [Coemansia sp. RSA 552]|nr:hypothetical protein GGF46_005279 [Coemansia sp. RSA 552]
MAPSSADGAKKPARHHTLRSSIRKSLKPDWPTASAPHPQRAPASASSDEPPPLPPRNSHAHHVRRPRRQQQQQQQDEEGKVHSIVELLMPVPTDSAACSGSEAKDDQGELPPALRHVPKKSSPWNMLRRLGALNQTGKDLRRRARFWARQGEYPVSDDPVSGKTARAWKKDIDSVFRQGQAMAQELGTIPLNRMEISRLLSQSHWDCEAALRRLQILLSTRDGILYDPDPRIQMRGAVNSGGTTCYIDSLLMALFGAQSSCEALLYMRDLGSDRANGLQALCRLLVNHLRAGELIDTGMVEELRSQLIDCGWQCDIDGTPPTNCHTQQDASELYMFLMEQLQMPYLPLEVRMVHGADYDEADSRVVTLRTIELSIPDPKDIADPRRPLLLQSLLETYFFDNRVEQLERTLKDGSDNHTQSPVTVRTNAWSVLSIHPFYTPQNEIGDRTAVEMAAEYPSDAPLIVPLLIKRYQVDSEGTIHRANQRVIVPLVLDVSDIVSLGRGGSSNLEDNKGPGSGAVQRADSNQSQPPPPPYPGPAQYRLVLRSAVCHKGAAANSGHYISYSTRLRTARPGEQPRLWRQENKSISWTRTTPVLQAGKSGGHWTAADVEHGSAWPARHHPVPESNPLHRRHSWPLLDKGAMSAMHRAVAPRDERDFGHSDDGAGQARASTAPASGCALTVSEFLRFDDLDIANDRVQRLTTEEDTHQCLDEISRDGYLLFYALQRVETEDGLGIDAARTVEGIASEPAPGTSDSVTHPMGSGLTLASESSLISEETAMHWQGIRSPQGRPPNGGN